MKNNIWLDGIRSVARNGLKSCSWSWRKPVLKYAQKNEVTAKLMRETFLIFRVQPILN